MKKKGIIKSRDDTEREVMLSFNFFRGRLPELNKLLQLEKKLNVKIEDVADVSIME